MKSIAYIRVSTNKQDVENQRLEILKLANDMSLGKVRMVDEVISGRKTWRDRAIAPIILEDLSKGDALIVAELSRLGRSMLDIMEILSTCSQKGIRIYAAKGGWKLDDTLQSKIVAMVLAMAAEIERDLISQRTQNALATKKALIASDGGYTSKSGKFITSLGRPKGPGKSKLDKNESRIRELIALHVPQKRIADLENTTEGNLHNWMKKRKITTARQK